MKKLLCAFAILFFGLFVAASARAADISGDWTATMSTPNGESHQMTFTFKQTGGTVTGSMQGGQGGPIEISNGKIDGNDFSFDVSFNQAGDILEFIGLWIGPVLILIGIQKRNTKHSNSINESSTLN